MNVEILAAPENVFEPTNIPQALKVHFASLGKRLTLTFAHGQNLAMRRAEGRVVVMRDEIPDDVWKEAKYFFDNPKKWDGELHTGDCMLVSQTYEAHDFWDDEYRRRHLVREQNYAEAAEIQQKTADALDRAGAPKELSKNWVEIHPTHSTAASDHVRGGADLAAEIAAAAAASGKKK